eukprot:CAMPEP_0182876984 /NCGR_PEP_ID=MMETSP0034_2-20130328/14478_1 /TAXON_ID=156128 /ORGANISM="Nephroselmis pyriformis, Strain CCMP717" /LENGTH=101 /DNA_ID=CAMNT_0025009801 /DNA_START=147 /DNA_END=448 /DNA_ORIENTATION=-
MVRVHPDTVSGLGRSDPDGLFTVEDNSKALAQEITRKRKRLPPVLNDNALFTRASPFASSNQDIFYHAPTARIARVLHPQAFVASFNKDVSESLGKEEDPG